MIRKLYKHSLEHVDSKIFTIVMFTDANPHVIKVLKDTDYTNAINDLSGSDITVFHTSLFKGRYKMPSSPPGTLCYMQPIWEEPAENRKLLPLFDMKDSTQLPCVVVFMFKENKVYHSVSKINDTTEQSSFNSIKEILERLTIAIKTSNDKLEAMQKAKFAIQKLNLEKGVKEFLQKLSEWRGAAGL